MSSHRACLDCGRTTVDATHNRCSEHEATHLEAQRAYNAGRGTREERGYGPGYSAARKRCMAEELVCSLCGEEGTDDDPLQCHHIVDVRDGGGHERENLTARHQRCHGRGKDRGRRNVTWFA